MGKFAEPQDVSDRFEGVIPSDRSTWVTTRIGDVESALMGVVPSLRKSVSVIDDESVEAGDPGRLGRVKALVCEKVLHLYRNPDGATQYSQTVDNVSESRTFGYGAPVTGVVFTAAELRSVRIPGAKSRFSSMPVAPWRITQ